MCGISGITYFNGKSIDRSLLDKMNCIQRHRGPDDEGIYISGNIGLGHRRLSVIDISKDANQPMSNEKNNLHIVYNGEIYNYLELREELVGLGYRFRTHSDTEVILYSYEQWGAECLSHFNGMWAFCIWDEENKKMFLSRDRFGVKPLYYYHTAEIFIFASEIKALLASGLVSARPNNAAIYNYLTVGLFSNTEKTFFENIEQLPAGHFMEIDIMGSKISLSKYWHIDLNEKEGALTDPEFEKQFLELFEDSVRIRMRSDVPIGAFLSGGLDSSSIVCMMEHIRQASDKTSHSLETITNIYKTEKFNETQFMRSVIARTGATAHYAYPSADKLLKDIDAIIFSQDEPVGTTRVYSQWEVYKLAKDLGLKVMLDGQGGDEILAGYTMYYSYYFSQLLKTMRLITLAGEVAVFPKTGEGDTGILLVDMLKRLFPENLKYRLRKKSLPASATTGINKDFLAKAGGGGRSRYLPVKYSNNIFDNFIYRIFLLMQPSHKMTDRTASYFSIENRSPFMDYRLVAFMLKSPDRQKIRHGIRKYVLRQAMKGILPEEVRTRRDKIHFPFDQDYWFRSHLCDYFKDMIYSESFKNRYFFNSKEIEDEYKIFCSGKGHGSARLWRYLNLELWMRRYIDNPALLPTLIPQATK